MFDNPKDNLSEVLNVLADGDYTGEKFATKVLEILNATVEVAKRSELHTFAVIPKRWVVERSFSWLDKCRRLWKKIIDRLLQLYANDYTILILYDKQVLRNKLNYEIIKNW